jgi:Fe-S cluster biosynthesis and repair protein YggX
MADDDRIARLKQLAESDPNDEMAHFSLGSALLEAGRHQDAGPCFQRVLALNAQNSRAYQLLGEAQKACGDTQFAITTLTNGYRVAHRRGDMMPMRAMAELLASLGAPVPVIAERRDPSAGAVAEEGFTCRRCGGPGPKLSSRPFKGPLGEQVLAGVCQSCWKEWVGMGTKVINELRLPMYDPQAQEQYDRYMKEFLMLD